MTIRDYGKCPQCGEPGKTRERRMNGNDRCVAFHVYPSADSVCSCTAMTAGYCGSRVCVNHRHGWPSKTPPTILERAAHLSEELATMEELIKVLEARLAYYEEREEDARYCAEYTLAVSTKHDHPAYAVARRYLSGDYPKK